MLSLSSGGLCAERAKTLGPLGISSLMSLADYMKTEGKNVYRQSIHYRHLEVHEYQVERCAASHNVDRLLAIAGSDHLEVLRDLGEKLFHDK